MVDELQIPPFAEWFPEAAKAWLLVAASLVVVGLLVGLLISVVGRGPIAGVRRFGQIFASGVVDLACMSPRRVFALAWLAVKESIRRRIVAAFAVFIVILLFAGWFLDPSSPNPAKLYLGFVLESTSYLVLVLMLFLSVFSLPADLKSRTLHTVVTKPVRPSEIVLGRMLGFTLLGSGLLAAMCAISYVFVYRGLDHTHVLTAENLSRAGQATGTANDAETGNTSSSRGHRHRVEITASGETHVEPAKGHTHSITVDTSGDQPAYTLGPPEGELVARVPVYGKLSFRGMDGRDAERGGNVGDEWDYRSYIAGGTQAAAIWTFTGIRREQFSESLPVEMNILVFRTYKGDIEKGVLGSLALRNPKTGLSVEVQVFESKEFAIKRIAVPTKLVSFSNPQIIRRTADGVVFDPLQVDESLTKKTEYDLFDDLTDNGRMEIWLRCLEPSQYFGVAQPDLYLRASDALFAVNFVKGYFGIWLQMVMVIAFGVMFSTFLSGAVAMIATLGVLIGGFYGDFMTKLALGETYGGGPFESLVRLVSHQNIVSPLDPGLGGTVAGMIDRVAGYGLWVMAMLMPHFDRFSYANHVASGFNVSWDLILVGLMSVIGFCLPVFVIGYFFLKTREVAR